MISKEEFLVKDRILKAISHDKTIRISVVKTTDVVKTAQRNHGLSPVAAVLLGRALTGAMLMASQLKGEERVKLTLQGDGDLGSLYAEANSVGEIRGFVQNKTYTHDWDTSRDIGTALGTGVLRFEKILYNEADPITGVVELQTGTVTEDLAFYLEQSEQIPSVLSLDVQVNAKGEVQHAGGYLVQAMPGSDIQDVLKVQQNTEVLSPVGVMLKEGLYIDDIMQNVMGELDAKELDRTPVHFFCRCKKERFVGALALLGVHDLKELEGEDQHLQCQYCSKEYQITAGEINHLIRQAQAKMN